MANLQLSELRTRLEQIASINTGNSYINSTQELQDLNLAYQETAYRYDWPQLLDRVGIVLVANVGRYTLPTNFRKSRTVYSSGLKKDETEFEYLQDSINRFSADRINSEIVLHEVPTTASTAYTFQNAETAASAVTIELDTVSGISQGDEIWIDSVSGTDEFTFVSSVDSTNNTITAKLRANKSAGDKLYRQKEILDINYYKTITLLSQSTDTTALPEIIDYAICHAAAAYLYMRAEQFDREAANRKIYERMIQDYWKAFDNNSTGYVTQFTI